MKKIHIPVVWFYCQLQVVLLKFFPFHLKLTVDDKQRFIFVRPANVLQGIDKRKLLLGKKNQNGSCRKNKQNANVK